MKHVWDGEKTTVVTLAEGKEGEMKEKSNSYYFNLLQISFLASIRGHCRATCTRRIKPCLIDWLIEVLCVFLTFGQASLAYIYTSNCYIKSPNKKPVS